MSIKFYKYLFIIYIKISVVLISIFGLKKVKINIYKKINYFLYNFKSIFIYFIFQLKIYLYIINNLFKNIDYLNIFSFKIVIINNKFIFNLDFLIFEGQVLFIKERFWVWNLWRFWANKYRGCLYSFIPFKIFNNILFFLKLYL